MILTYLAQIVALMVQAVPAGDAFAGGGAFIPARDASNRVATVTGIGLDAIADSTSIHLADTTKTKTQIPDSTTIQVADTLRAGARRAQMDTLRARIGALRVQIDSLCAPSDTLCSQADSVILPKYTVALKTNLLYDVLSAVNFSVEFPIGERFSIEVQDIFPWWNWGPHGNKYAMQYLSVGPEFRWWFSRTDDRKYLTGHWVGLYAHAGKYDFQRDKDICRQNKFFSTGLSYGYSMPICSWLNMEFTVSVGYARMKFQHYQPSDDYENLYKDKYNSGKMDYFGPTKLGVTLTLPIDFYRRSDREARRAQHRSCLSATEQIPQLADTEE